MSFFSGTPDRFQQIFKLGPEQQALYGQLTGLAEGAFPAAANYYKGLLSENPYDFERFAAPEMRRFREDIIPSLSEQFAGMGSGALSSSGFRNAAVNAGTDLAERLGSLRAQLRQQGAQGLMNIGSQGLQQFNENIYRPQQPGFMESFAPAIGSLAGSFFGPIGTAAGGALGNWLSQSKKGASSPYGKTQPQVG